MGTWHVMNSVSDPAELAKVRTALWEHCKLDTLAMVRIRNNPLFNIPHCRLFHNLQSHSQVPLKHLCGIGSIWVDIHIRHQKFIENNKDT